MTTLYKMTFTYNKQQFLGFTHTIAALLNIGRKMLTVPSVGGGDAYSPHHTQPFQVRCSQPIPTCWVSLTLLPDIHAVRRSSVHPLTPALPTMGCARLASPATSPAVSPHLLGFTASCAPPGLISRTHCTCTAPGRATEASLPPRQAVPDDLCLCQVMISE